MGTSRVALIIPIHPPHYHFIYELLAKPIPDLDIYFIFTCQRDVTLFNPPVSTSKWNSMIMADSIARDLIIHSLRANSIVTLKKWWALSRLDIKAYDYAIVCDAEITFIKSDIDIHELCRKQVDAKLFVSAIPSGLGHHRFTKTSLHYLVDRDPCIDYAQAEKEVDTIGSYTWFSDVPVYDMSTVTRFLRYIRFNNAETTVERLSFDVFDYIVYAYYMILYHGYKTVHIPIVTGWGSCEELSDIEVYLVSYRKYRLGWALHGFYLDYKPYIDALPDVYMTFHLDRF
jgi:hypothetical protein